MRDYDFYYTKDGSIGLYSYVDDDVYHSKYGAISEAWEKFIIPSGIDKKLNECQNIKVLDICYGIGYNTKALMSYVINKNEKFLYKKNIFEKFLNKIKKIKNNFKNKKRDFLINNETIDNDNIYVNNKILSPSNDTIESKEMNNLFTKIKIDCLDINSELVKISPLLKTVITPQEFFCRIMPRFFDCFDFYWEIRLFLSKITFKFLPKNKKEIKDLLDLKFNNNYDILDNEYRIHEFVNYILLDSLTEQFKDNYFNNELKKIITSKKKKRFFERNLLNYAKFKQNSRYNLISKSNLTAFLHNIYYDHLSNRYKKASFNKAKELFKLNFYIDDARKSILNLTGQYDLIFLDAFTYSKAPELWTVEFIAELYQKLSPKGVIMTYSNSALVRNTFLENNFYIGKIYNKKTNTYTGTIAAKEKSLIEHPLTNFEVGLCNTKAGIPYHDPTLSLTKQQILKQREYEFKNSELLTSSQYMKIRSRKKDVSDENDFEQEI